MVGGPLYVRRGATLTCSIRVNASLQVPSDINIVAAWMKGNVQLIDNNHTNISDTNSNSSIFETNVTFVPIQFSDSGNYSCEVTLFSIATGSMLLTRSSMIFFTVEGEFDYFKKIFISCYTQQLCYCTHLLYFKKFKWSSVKVDNEQW